MLLLISGCSSTPIQKIEVNAKPVQRPELVLPNVDRLTMKEVEWIIITEENAPEVFAKLKEKGLPVALFGLTDSGYKNIAENLNDIRSMIQQYQTIIAAYEAYYKESERAIDAANAEIEGAKQQVEEQQQQTKEEPSALGKLKFW